MKPILRRALAMVGVASLTAAGVALTAAPAQALPGSVEFSEQTCDIDTGGALGLTVDGVDFTVTNSAEIAEPLTYEIRVDFETYIASVTNAPGESRRHVIELPEDVNSTIQVVDVATAAIVGGAVIEPNCTPNSSPAAVATISAAECELPSGGILPPSPGFLWTLDNSAGVGPADYAFIIDGAVFESGTVDAGDTRVRAAQLEPNGSGTSAITSVDAQGAPVTLATGSYDLECDPEVEPEPEPDFNHSPEATGSVTDATCVPPTGLELLPTVAVVFTLDNEDGTAPADYAFLDAETVVESGIVAAGESTTISLAVVEDSTSLVQVTSVDAEGEPVVLDSAEVSPDCLATTPTITTPTAGQVFTNNPVTIAGTGGAGNEIAIVVIDSALVEDIIGGGGGMAPLAAPADPIIDEEGLTAYVATVDEDGQFSIEVELENGEYAVSAAATRAPSESEPEGAVSAPSEAVLFSVDILAPVVTTPPGGGKLAATGTELGLLPVGLGTLLLGLGAGALMIRRRGFSL